MRKDKAVVEKSITKFKGLSASRSGTSLESVGVADDQLVDLVNWNIHPLGYLEKRWGTTSQCTITVPTTPSNLRIIGMMQQQYGVGPWLFVTDGLRVWKVNTNILNNYVEIQSAGASIANLQWMVEYGGTASSTAYSMTGIRWAAGGSSAVGGIFGLTAAGVGTAFVANTPVGTHITLFKDRAWVINSQGNTISPGDETRVWFSAPTDLANYGGAGLPNNFNLDFGDGDFLVASIPFNDQLYFFKTRKIYIVSVEGDPTNWQTRPITERVGCVGRGTIKLIDGKLYFLSLDGVVRFDGASAEIISDPISDLLETYRDFKNPDTVMNAYASNWNNKYILWLPKAGYGDNALVFDVPSSTWTTWKLSNGVSSFGEAKMANMQTDSIFLGSWTGNQVWRMTRGNNLWTDNGLPFMASFMTRKQDMGQPMSHKRNYLVGLTAKDESVDPGTYVLKTKADDLLPVTRTEVPGKLSVTNMKFPGAGYGRYFQTEVQQQSTAYAAVYDITWVAEERGLMPYSGPVKNTVVQEYWTLGPHDNDRLDSGFVLK